MDYKERRGLIEALLHLEDALYHQHCSHQGAIRETAQILAARILIGYNLKPLDQYDIVDRVIRASRAE